MNNESIMMEMLQNLVVSVDSMQHNMNKRFDQVEARLENVETRLANVEVRLENVEVRLGKLETDMVDVKVRLENVETNLHALNGRVEALEKTNSGIGEMFEHTVRLQQEATDSIHEVLQFHAHKITENEKSIYFLKNKLSS
ncbi:hypothetical protein P9B03_10990 [Metasolibacillus meyeri]|uniref:Uncharacterized protein n=1 Tax=Metasolibacillus meyeri TaxID=1071052 RepID=A0AAW9NTB9_9BACL|nr:hypothetical protein [Metasolibacillus meyeri]MEC1179009.1 hypothetical protein [Metasolibacillus meyeri]